MDNKDIDGLNKIYKELAVEFGVDVAHKMYEQYGGLQIVFPNKFESAQYIREKIVDGYNRGEKVQALAKKYGYSERYLRKLLKENITESEI